MSSKTFIVFLDLPIKISRKIDRVRKKYNPRSYREWKAHFTLKQAENLVISEKKLKQIVSQFAKKTSQIRLSLGEIKIQGDRNFGWNIYISICRNRNLIKIIKTLSRVFEPFIDCQSPKTFTSTKWEQSNKFYPHISIKGEKDSDQCKRLLTKIKSEKIRLPDSIICKTITLAKWQNNHWQKIVKYKLNLDNRQ